MMSLLLNFSTPINAAEVALINQNHVTTSPTPPPVLPRALSSIKDIESKISDLLGSSGTSTYGADSKVRLMAPIHDPWPCGDNAKATLDSAGVLTIDTIEKGTPGIMKSYTEAEPPEWHGEPYRNRVKRITIGDEITSIGDYAFYDCEALSSASIPSSVRTIGDSAFLGCKSLVTVDISEGVATIKGSAFGSTGLNVVTIPNSVTEIKGNAFMGCNSLTCLIIGNGVQTIEDLAFADCPKLYSINFKGTKSPSGYASGSLPFDNSGKKLKEVYVPKKYNDKTFCDLKIKNVKDSDLDKCRTPFDVESLSKGWQVFSAIAGGVATVLGVVSTILAINTQCKHIKD